MNSGLCWKADERDLSLREPEHKALAEDEVCVVGRSEMLPMIPNSWFSCPCVFPSIEYGLDIETRFQQWKCGRNDGKSLLGIEWKKKSGFLRAAPLWLSKLLQQLPCCELSDQEAQVSRNWGNSLANSLQTREPYQQPREWTWKWASACGVLRWLSSWPMPWLQPSERPAEVVKYQLPNK